MTEMKSDSLSYLRMRICEARKILAAANASSDEPFLQVEVYPAASSAPLTEQTKSAYLEEMERFRQMLRSCSKV